MNKNRFYVGLLVTAILAVLVYASYGMVNAGKKETYHSVAVIVDDSSSDRWTAFKEGLEQGADEENFHINVVSTSSFVNLHEECSIISRELENGADGVIVQLCGDDADGLFSGIVSGVPTVLAENEGESESLFTTVMADPYEIGRTIGENLLAGAGDSLSGFTVGILSGNQKMKSQRQRSSGPSPMRKLETRAPWNATGRKNLPPCWWRLTTMRRSWPETLSWGFPGKNRSFTGKAVPRRLSITWTRA